MRRVLAASALTFSLCIPATFTADRPSKGLQRLARLYEQGRYFELREELAPLTGDQPLELVFFRGAIDQAFNRLDSAVTELRAFLHGAGSGPERGLQREAWILLADAFRRLGRYRDASETYRELLSRFGSILAIDERANYENQLALWSALAGAPPQTAEASADTAIRMADRLLLVSAAGRTFFAGYDTGANLSILCESLADELGVAIDGPAIKIQSGTGRWVIARPGIVPELRLGSHSIRNFVVLIFPDDEVASTKTPSGVKRRGLLGAPVLEAFGEFSETADGRFLIPARPSRRSPENMFLLGFMPVVEVIHRGDRLAMALDTGSPTTLLFPPYYRRYRGEINWRARERAITLRGVGGSQTVPVRVLDEFSFRAGGRNLSFQRVLVHTRETHSLTHHLQGSLGLNILSQCQRMTLNYKSMSFILE